MTQITSTIENFLKTIAFKAGDKILAAVSGGTDSVAMLHLLHNLHKTGDGYHFPGRVAAADQREVDGKSQISNFKFQIICAHINHHLRGKESDEDEKFVTNLCMDWNIPICVEQIDVNAYAKANKLSIETAARHLRLEALERIALKTGCKYIATAHHKDDQAETVLFRLLRGTAFAGLAGIRPQREHRGLQWIRPMLNIRRAEIESYCKKNNISWRNDASNIETHYRRNWIRHKLLPHLQKQSNAGLTEKLAILAQSSLALQQHIELAADKIFQSKIEDRKSKITLSAAAIQHAGPFVAGEILRAALNQLGCGLRDISLSHYQRFFYLLDKNNNTLQLPGGCIIRKKSDTLIFEAVNSPKEPCLTPDTLKLSINNTQLSMAPCGPWSIQTRIIQITTKDFEAFQKEKNNFKQWFDLKKIKSPLIIRDRRDNDSFTPFGRKTKKRINRFLSDSQIPENQRKTCFIIEDKTGILWLAPIRRSTLAAITSRTIDVLEIQINES